MSQFSNVCGASPVNNQILLFDGHSSHFDGSALRHMMCKKIQPFVLKEGDTINGHPNDNGPNSKLKSLLNAAKNAWMLKYGTKMFLPHHRNSVLVEAWDSFKVSAGNIIRDSFAKTMILPLIPTNLTTNTQACTASIQVSFGPRAEEINNISRQAVVTI